MGWLATAGVAWLPHIFMGPQGLFGGWGATAPAMALALDVASLLLLSRLRRPNSEQIWLAVGMVAACFDVWVTYSGGSRFSSGWYFSKLGSLFTTLVVLLSMFTELTSLYRRTAELNLRLDAQAHVDGLTGLANRRRFDEALASECARAARADKPISLLMIDVDLFKRFNDRYGHVAGDECLKAVAGAIGQSVHRAGDLAARYGGEEFAVILPSTTLGGAMVLAERIRTSLAQLELKHAASASGAVTLSIGIAQAHYDGALNATALVERADTALYRAKQSGRDRVCYAELAPQVCDDTLADALAV